MRVGFGLSWVLVVGCGMGLIFYLDFISAGDHHFEEVVATAYILNFTSFVRG